MIFDAGTQTQVRRHRSAGIQRERAVERRDAAGARGSGPVEVVRHDHDGVGASRREQVRQVRIGIVDELVALVPARRSARGGHREVVAGALRDELLLHLPDEQGVGRLERVRHRLEVEVHAVGVPLGHRPSDLSRQAVPVRPVVEQGAHVAVVPVPRHHRDGEDHPDAMLMCRRDHVRHRGGVPPRPAGGRWVQRSVAARPDREVGDRGDQVVVEIPERAARQRPVRQVAEDLVAQAVRQAGDPADAPFRGRRTSRHVRRRAVLASRRA